MSKKSKKVRGGGLVYSTDKKTMSNIFSEMSISKESSTPGTDHSKKYDDEVRVWIDRKGRGGKEVTLIKGIKRPDSQLKEFAKIIKSKCGVGGTAKGGEIIIQGNHRDRVIKILINLGFHLAKKAGG